MSFPFPDRNVEKTEQRFTPLPHQVDYITSYAECVNMMDNGSYSASGRAQLLNDPRYLQYAEYFNAFGYQDRSIRKTDTDGNEQIQYHGGCRLLLKPETRKTLWPAAREQLREQLFRYHTGQNIQENTLSPSVSCDANAGGNVYCWK